MEVVERVLRCWHRLSGNRAWEIASSVEEALDGDVRRDGVSEVPAVGEGGREGDDAGGWQAGFQVDHGVPAGFVVVGPQDDRGGACQQGIEDRTANPLGAALPGDDDVGREELGSGDSGFLALYDQDGVVRAPGEEVEVKEGDRVGVGPALPAPVAGVERVGKLVFGREEPEGTDVLGAVGQVEPDDVGMDSSVRVVVWPGGGAVPVRLGGVGAVAVLEGIERALGGLVIVADAEELASPGGCPADGECLVLGDEGQEIATLASGVVVPEALLGALEFDVQRVAGVAEDVADDPLGADAAASGEELGAEFFNADGECVREFVEFHGCL
jgi:hypothetical protein